MRAHLAARDDGLVRVASVLGRYPDFADMLEVEPTGIEMNALRRAETSGRPLGGKEWLERLGMGQEKRGRKAR